jgi:hypothetical protein
MTGPFVSFPGRNVGFAGNCLVCKQLIFGDYVAKVSYHFAESNQYTHPLCDVSSNGRDLDVADTDYGF